jgi:hypothetical protein
VDGCNQFARYPAVLRPFAASESRAMSVVPLTPEVQLAQEQADLATLQYVLAHLIVPSPPNDQEIVVVSWRRQPGAWTIWTDICQRDRVPSKTCRIRQICPPESSSTYR